MWPCWRQAAVLPSFQYGGNGSPSLIPAKKAKNDGFCLPRKGGAVGPFIPSTARKRMILKRGKQLFSLFDPCAWVLFVLNEFPKENKGVAIVVANRYHSGSNYFSLGKHWYEKNKILSLFSLDFWIFSIISTKNDSGKSSSLHQRHLYRQRPR